MERLSSKFLVPDPEDLNGAIRNVLATLLFVLLSWSGHGQSTSTSGLMVYGRLTDARAEAMGGANAALSGDTRTLLQSPASLIDMDGIEVYYRNATPYYRFETSLFQHAALAYRISERFAIGLRYDNDLLNSDALAYFATLNFGDMVDPHRGFLYPSGPSPGAHMETLAGTLAFKVKGGLSVGASVENIVLSPAYGPLVYGSLGIRQVLKLKGPSDHRRTVRLSASCQDLTAAHNERSFSYGSYVFTYRQDLPVIARLAASYEAELRYHWLVDTLPSLRFTAHVQYDDDLTSRYSGAVRLGGELQVLGLLALRCGWYTLRVDDFGRPDTYHDRLAQFTYGAGVNMPLDVLTKGRWPLSVSIDYTSLPQVSFTTDERSGPAGRPWPRFQSYGIRLNYGLGRACKPKPVQAADGS